LGRAGRGWLLALSRQPARPGSEGGARDQDRSWPGWGTVARVVHRADRRPGRAGQLAADRARGHSGADRALRGAPGRMRDQGQHRVTRAGPAPWGPPSRTRQPSRRSPSGASCWPGSRPDGGPPAACWSGEPSMNWPASSACTIPLEGPQRFW